MNLFKIHLLCLIKDGFPLGNFDFGNILSIINIIIGLYVIYRIQIYSKTVDIITKSRLYITWFIPDFEFMEIENKGSISIDSLRVKSHYSLEYKDTKTNLGVFSYERVTVLHPEEKMIIPHHEKIRDLLINNKVMGKSVVEIPMGEDPYTEETIYGDREVYHIIRAFKLTVKIEISYNILKESHNINKTYELKYGYIPEYFELEQMRHFDYNDNFIIKIDESSGNWIDV